jgi:hypothetical protein
MALRAHCGFALLGVLGVIVLAYLRLTILKIDPTQEPTETQPARDLSKDSESFAANRLRNLDDHQCEILSIQLKVCSTKASSAWLQEYEDGPL